MNDSKIKKLTEAARNGATAEPPFNFAGNVIAAIHRDERRPAYSVFDQLGSLFPRLAWAAVAVITLCVASDLYFSQKEATLSAEWEQGTEQWLFAGNQ